MDFIAIPASTTSRRWLFWLIPPAVAAVAVGVLWLISGTHTSAPAVAANMIYHVTPIDMDVKISKDGELQAVNNIDVICRVEGQPMIQTLVDEGSSVKQGDVLMTLDSSAIKEKIEDTTLNVQQAEAALTTAKEMTQIQESQNTANLEAAQVALKLAQLDMKQYEDGTYPQMLANAKTDLEMAKTTLKNTQEKLGQTRTLFAKGFVTASAVKDDELTVTNARNALDKAQTALTVLTDYTHQMDLASKQSAVSQAEQSLVRTRRENASNLAQKVADSESKEEALSLWKRRLEHLQEQLQFCTIKAPADGLVVYGTSSDHNNQNPIQEGGTVRERQLLFRLPDTSSMKAVVRIQEAQVSKLHEGQNATVNIVGLPHPVSATLTKISVLADNSQRWWNPDLKEYPVDLELDQTPAGLKPGMGATASISVDHAVNVNAVPLSTLYSAGSDSYVFVRNGEHFVPRKVRIGRTNEINAEILENQVQGGDDVLILQAGQGQELLAEAGIKPAPTTQMLEPGTGGNRRNPKQRENTAGEGTSGTSAGTSAGAAAAVTPGGIGSHSQQLSGDSAQGLGQPVQSHRRRGNMLASPTANTPARANPISK